MLIHQKNINYSSYIPANNRKQNPAPPTPGQSTLLSLNQAKALKAIAFAAKHEPASQKFTHLAMTEDNPKWGQAVTRASKLKPDNTRSEFIRDYDRIIHSDGYKRLKGKTLVFNSPKIDHVSTRTEHVELVARISEVICQNLGLNAELARAIAIGHDVGHTPFGHEGEYVLRAISKDNEMGNFWHERNSLKFLDKFEKVEGEPLNLTYAVRDGIICHCGEADQNGLKPRNEAFDLLENIHKPGLTAPYTWEGCVVKLSDKIAYLGRDIDEAQLMGLITKEKVEENFPGFSTSDIVKTFINDVIENSNPERGIGLSHEKFSLMTNIKQFNTKEIYLTPHPRKDAADDQVKLVINWLYKTLDGMYDQKKPEQGTLANINKNKELYPNLCEYFEKWLTDHNSVYKPFNKKSYQQAVIDYISGMTDKFALHAFDEITAMRR